MWQSTVDITGKVLGQQKEELKLTHGFFTVREGVALLTCCSRSRLYIIYIYVYIHIYTCLYIIYVPIFHWPLCFPTPASIAPDNLRSLFPPLTTVSTILFFGPISRVRHMSDVNLVATHTGLLVDSVSFIQSFCRGRQYSEGIFLSS